MKTNQIMTRHLLGHQVKQRTEDGYFELSSLEIASTGLRHSLGLRHFNGSQFLRQKGTQEFCKTLEAKIGAPAYKAGSRGRGHKTWVHPYLMLKIALAMSPELEVEVMGWIYDELIKYRTDSGDSYKKMCGSLYTKFKDSRTFTRFIADSAVQVREVCGVEDWNTAQEPQLKLRDRIHDTIAIVADVIDSPRDAVRLGIARALKENGTA